MLVQLKVNLMLSIIIVKIYSHDVMMKKQQNFKIHLELQHKDKYFIIKWNIVETACPYTLGTS